MEIHSSVCGHAWPIRLASGLVPWEFGISEFLVGLSFHSFVSLWTHCTTILQRWWTLAHLLACSGLGRTLETNLTFLTLQFFSLQAVLALACLEQWIMSYRLIATLFNVGEYDIITIKVIKWNCYCRAITDQCWNREEVLQGCSNQMHLVQGCSNQMHLVQGCSNQMHLVQGCSLTLPFDTPAFSCQSHPYILVI